MISVSPLAGQRLRLRTPASIPVALCLPSLLWSRLLVQALSQLADLEVSILDPAAVSAYEGVLVSAVPTSRGEWERLAHWCRTVTGRAPLRVLVLGDNRPALATRALRLGAYGYLDWESPLPTLVKAIRRVAAGELWAERKTALALVHAGGVSAAGSRLTRREKAVLEALAEGRRNKEIADRLGISEATVKSHLNRVYHKLHLSDRLQAALYLERHGVDL